MYQLVQHSPRSRDAFATAETAGRLQVPVRCLDVDLGLAEDPPSTGLGDMHSKDALYLLSQHYSYALQLVMHGSLAICGTSASASPRRMLKVQEQVSAIMTQLPRVQLCAVIAPSGELM
eukprot:1175721-Prorocentrum_minimum.AAC.3